MLRVKYVGVSIRFLLYLEQICHHKPHFFPSDVQNQLKYNKVLPQIWK